MVYPAAKVFADDISLHTTERPALKYRSFRILDQGGIPNSKLDPGETAELVLLLRNAGAAAPSTVANLVSCSPFVEVLDTFGAFPACAAGETAVSQTDWFVVRALTSAPVEVPLWCILVLSGDSYADTLRIPLIVGDSMNLATGPDAGGYCIFDWTDSCYQQLPEYDYFELSGLGTRLAIGDDETRVLPLPLGFGPWRFYGQSYDSISICSNGWVAAGSTERCDFVNVELPYVGAPPNIVAFVWDDLAPSLGGDIWYMYDSLRHRFIVEFDSIHYFGLPDRWEKVQVHLYDTTIRTPTGDNSMTIQFRTVNDFRSATVGLQNQDGTVGLTYVWNEHRPRTSSPLLAQRALRFETMQLLCSHEPIYATVGLPRLSVVPRLFRSGVFLKTEETTGLSMRICDIAGRVIRTIACRIHEEVYWDGCDSFGSRVGPGVYFVYVAGCPAAVAKLVCVSH
ncbi:MAG: hypothetical protein ABIK43_04500 [candidate division WOR-3 bacterium]